MKKLIGLMLLDLVCWVGLTGALVYNDYLIAAAIAGALGLMVMSKEVRTTLAIKRTIEMVQNMGDYNLFEAMRLASQRLRTLWAVKSTGSLDITTLSQWVYDSFEGEITLEHCTEVVSDTLPLLIEGGEIVDGVIIPEVMEELDVYISYMVTDQACNNMMA